MTNANAPGHLAHRSGGPRRPEHAKRGIDNVIRLPRPRELAVEEALDDAEALVRGRDTHAFPELVRDATTKERRQFYVLAGELSGGDAEQTRRTTRAEVYAKH